MSFKLGDTVTAQCKRRLGRHIGKILEINKDDIIITNGFETVRIDLSEWEVKKK